MSDLTPLNINCSTTTFYPFSNYNRGLWELQQYYLRDQVNLTVEDLRLFLYNVF